MIINKLMLAAVSAILLVIILGLIVPWLVSQASTLSVLLGVVVVLITLWCTGLVIERLLRKNLDSEQHDAATKATTRKYTLYEPVHSNEGILLYGFATLIGVGAVALIMFA